MKKKFTLTVLLLFNVGAYSQTYISGFINANTTWNMAGSPYIVTANALVSQSYTLTIQPGVVVKFNTNCALQIDGQLIAIGTPSSHITFTSNQASPQAGDWGKLHFSGYCIGATFDANGHYLSGSIMKYADVLYAGGSGYGGVHIESSWPYISQCTVRLSKAAGIYCAGSTFILDSSLVADNSDYGLYFDDYSRFSCGLVVNGDTVRNNSNGGLYLGISSYTCSTMISNCHFISNNNNAAIWDYYTFSNVVISNNFFSNNSSSNKGTVYFNANSGIYNRIKIMGNYFSGNTGNGVVAFVQECYQITINQNYFFNNNSQGAIVSFYNGYSINGFSYDTISCNTFLKNTTIFPVIWTRTDYPVCSGIISNNIFDGNINNTTIGGVFAAAQANAPLYFSNNIVRNNSSPLSASCYINTYLQDSSEFLHFNNNEFYNNTAKYVIKLDGPQTNNVHYDFLYMKHNNFLDVNYQIELYNHIPFGSPNVYADSNYWGSTSTQHIDSIISDYFDSTNYSVVYYSPILTQAIEVDTSCSLGFPTVVSEKKNVSVVSSTFPNPFSSFTTITISKELKDASLFLFDVYGRKVREVVGINGKEISLRRESLPAGIYLYQIVEKGERVANGKVVAE